MNRTSTRENLREVLSPEARLVLASVCTPKTELSGQVREGSARKLDWALIESLVERHGVAPLVYRSWSATARCAAPSETVKALRCRARQVAAANLRLTRDLLGILGLLEGCGIGAIPFKGPLLAQSAYGDVTLREFRDLDVLVQEHDVERATQALRSGGYRPDVEPAREWRRVLLKPDHAQVFWADSKAASLDLHWTLADSSFSYQVAMDRLWARQQRRPLGGTEVRSLSAEDTLLLLCVHGAKHSWESLLWVCDVAQFVEAHPALDWKQASVQAREAGVERAFLLGLSLANTLLETELPQAMAPALASDASVAPLTIDVCRSLFEVDNAPARAARQFLPLKILQRRGSKARYAWMLALRALLPNEKDRDNAPWAAPPFVPFLMRPFRLARAYGPRLLSSRMRKRGRSSGVRAA